MHHAGRVVSRTELVEHLYDQDFDRDSNTIEVFVGRIRKKLGVDVIQTVRGLGYLLTPPRMRANSLALRLFLSATAWTVVILFVTGFVLSSLYREAVERAFDRRLGVYLHTLVADLASPEDGEREVPQSLGEPLFELPLSGWYWQVDAARPASPRCARRARCGIGLPHLAEQRPCRRRPGGNRAGLCAGPGGPAAAAGRAHRRSRRRRPLSGRGRRRRRRDRRRDAQPSTAPSSSPSACSPPCCC